MLKVGWSNEENRATWIQKALATIPAGSRILDAGAGEQQYRKFCSHLKYVSQDSAEYKPSTGNTALQMATWEYGKLDIVSDITAIPESDNSFEAILCAEVFEHLPDPIAALKEFSRLLKRNGQLLLTAPFCSLTHFAPYHFSSGFNSFWYETHLPAQGFKVVQIERNGNYFEFLAQELRRIPWVAERYAHSAIRPWQMVPVQMVLLLLQRLTQRDSGSGELLCYGYHVRAVRQ